MNRRGFIGRLFGAGAVATVVPNGDAMPALDNDLARRYRDIAVPCGTCRHLAPSSSDVYAVRCAKGNTSDQCGDFSCYEPAMQFQHEVTKRAILDKPFVSTAPMFCPLCTQMMYIISPTVPWTGHTTWACMACRRAWAVPAARQLDARDATNELLVYLERHGDPGNRRRETW